MQRGWIGATAERLVTGPSRGRGRRRILYRYAVVDGRLAEVCTPDELLASLETDKAPEGARLHEHYVGSQKGAQ